MPKALSEPKVEEFRRRLCAVAATQFARRGYAGVTMRELAKALRVSAMTPYRYFRDRDEILASARAAAFGCFSDCLEKALARRGDALSKSRAVGRAYLDFALAHPQDYRLMFDLTQPDESRYPELSRQSARAKAVLKKQVAALAEAGLVSADTAALEYTLWAAIHGVIVLHLAGKYTRAECLKAYRQAMGFLFSGFALSAAPQGHIANKRRRS